MPVCQLHNIAGIHDGDAVGYVAHHSQVMGDKQICQPEPGLQVLHQVHHLGPDGHIQGTHRLICHNELGFQSQGPGNAHPLALAPAEGVGIAGAGIRRQAHQFQKLCHLACRLFGVFHDTVHQKRLCYDINNFHAGIQTGVRVLEHQLHVPAQGPDRFFSSMGDIFALEMYGTGTDRHPAEYGPAGGAFSGT